MSNTIKKQQAIQLNINPSQSQRIDENENTNIINETYSKFKLITYNNEELNYFKDNILSLLKERDKIFLLKLNEYKLFTEKIKNDFDSMDKISKTKFSNIIEVQAKINLKLDKLDDFETFVTGTNDKLTSHEIRLTNIREDFSKATQKYDKIYLDNLELPGYIGPCCTKYKNCQNFFLDVIKDLATLNKYREKNIIDLKMYKDKLETIISTMNSILDNNNKSQIKYINEAKDNILNDCNKMFESVCENMKDIRVENSKYSVDLIAKTMDLSKKWDKIEKIKEELLENFNYSVNKYQMLTDDTIKSFEDFKTEYNIIRRKFMELAEFIKDVRFRKNIGENVKKKEVKVMVKKLLRKRKSFDSKDVQLLSDIENIENIDYKKYYFVDNKNDDNSHNETTEKNNHLKLSQERKNDKKNSKINLYKIKNQNNTSLSKEIINKKNLSKTNNEELHTFSIKAKNVSPPSVNEIKKNFDYSNRSINISPINMHNAKSNRINNSEILNNKNNVILGNKMENKKITKEKINNEAKGNDVNIMQNKINSPKNNDQNLNSQENLSSKDNNKNDNVNKCEEKINVIENENKSQKINIPNENNFEKNENKNPLKSSDLSKIINNSESKQNTNINNETSIISESGNNITYNNLNPSDNNIIGISSEKSLSFISDNNNNNINKFLLNENQIVHRDKVIKELASELEQSTAKKDKLASNKKDIEEHFKKACNNIEPINLLNQKEKEKENNIKKDNTDNMSNENLNNNNNNKEKCELQEKGITMKNFSNLNNINKSINEYMNNLNPIKVSNEIHINDSTNAFHKKMYIFDQKLLNLELFTKEKIIDIIGQINLLKNFCKLPINEALTKEKRNLDLNGMNHMQTKTVTNLKYRTFNNSFTNNQNSHDSFYSEKNKENISNNNNNIDNFKNINFNTNSNINNNINNNNLKTHYKINSSKRQSLKEINPKVSFPNQKMVKKNNNNVNNSVNNNTVFNNIYFNNINTTRTNSVKNEIIEEANTKIIQNINNDINSKFLKEIEKKVENGNLLKNCFNIDDINYKNHLGSSRNNFAYSNSTFKGTEIRLVDLNKLVNNQLPKNRLNPIIINDTDYFLHLNGK